jgi:cytochrome c oxidase subunit 4
MSHDAHATEFVNPWKKVAYPLTVLFLVTVVEFVVALAIPESMMPKSYKSGLYIVLTILKAFYIVGFFMHLRYEKLTLIYCIVVPLAFIVVLIAALIFEGTSLSY